MADPASLASNWGSIVAAIGALGTAACGLVDALKTLPGGGISYSGFWFIRGSLETLFGKEHLHRLPLSRDLQTLHGNWINGRPMADQQAIAKSLVKLRLTTGTAKALADATCVDGNQLESLAKKLTTGESMTPEESNQLGRFDLELTALIDQAYQRADQCYRNWCKCLALVFSIALAAIGAYAMDFARLDQDWWLCILAGLLATPLAPMTKDLTSALSAGVKVAQSVKH
jgi:hypothetical protein